MRRSLERLHRGRCIRWGLKGAQRLVVEVFSGGESGNGGRSFVGQTGAFKDTGCEGKVACIEHLLGEVGSGCLDEKGICARARQLRLFHSSTQWVLSLGRTVRTEKGGGGQSLAIVRLRPTAGEQWSPSRAVISGVSALPTRVRAVELRCSLAAACTPC